MGAGWDRAGRSCLPRAEGGGLNSWPAAPGPVSWQTPMSQEPWGRAPRNHGPCNRGNEPPVGGTTPASPDPCRALAGPRLCVQAASTHDGPVAPRPAPFYPAPLGFSQRLPQSLALQRGCLGLPVTQEGGVQETREEGWRASVSVHVCKRGRKNLGLRTTTRRKTPGDFRAEGRSLPRVVGAVGRLSAGEGQGQVWVFARSHQL